MTETSENPRSGAIHFSKADIVYPNGVVGMKNLDLEIQPGEFVVVVGSSGAGKSTLLRAINGLNKLTSGRVEVNGEQVPNRFQPRAAPVRKNRSA